MAGLSMQMLNLLTYQHVVSGRRSIQTIMVEVPFGVWVWTQDQTLEGLGHSHRLQTGCRLDHGRLMP